MEDVLPPVAGNVNLIKRWPAGCSNDLLWSLVFWRMVHFQISFVMVEATLIAGNKIPKLVHNFVLNALIDAHIISGSVIPQENSVAHRFEVNCCLLALFIAVASITDRLIVPSNSQAIAIETSA